MKALLLLYRFREIQVKSKITIIESLELYIGALIFFWPRIIIAILLLTICSILIVLPSIFFAKNKPYPNFLRIY